MKSTYDRETILVGLASDIAKLLVYIAALGLVGAAARLGLLPRTRRIVPGELMVAD